MQRSLSMFLCALAVAGCSSSSTSSDTSATTVVTSGSDQSATVGTALSSPLTVQVLNTGGAPVAGVVVTFAVIGGNGTLGSSTATTDASGLASTTFTVGTRAGADTVTATPAVDDPGLAKAMFVLTALADAPAAVMVVAGDNQSATAGSALPAPLEVQVLDQYGNPVPNVPVTWSAPAGSLLSSQTTTDANGDATDDLTLPAAPGPDQVQVAVGASLTAKFTEVAN